MDNFITFVFTKPLSGKKQFILNYVNNNLNTKDIVLIAHDGDSHSYTEGLVSIMAGCELNRVMGYLNPCISAFKKSKDVDSKKVDEALVKLKKSKLWIEDTTDVNDYIDYLDCLVTYTNTHTEFIIDSIDYVLSNNEISLDELLFYIKKVSFDNALHFTLFMDFDEETYESFLEVTKKYTNDISTFTRKTYNKKEITIKREYIDKRMEELTFSFTN